MAPTHPSVFPYLRYDDADAALAWLARAFGFVEHAVHRDPAGTIVHAEMVTGNGMVMVSSTRGDDGLGMRSARTLGATSQGVYVVIAEPDALFARATAADAVVVRPVEDTDYGSRDFTVRDFEGNLWSFGTYQPFES